MDFDKLKTMSLSFQRAALSDIAQIQSLAKTIWHAHYPSIISVEQIDYMLSKMYSTEQITSELESGATFYEFIMRSETAVGFLSCTIEPTEHTMKLSKLYVKPDAHGTGVGRAALAHIEQHALEQKLSSVYLFVNKQNTKAIRAYERFGFTVETSVVADIGNGYVMDDFKMRKYIS
jgi:diamine N-acetyltransferase